MASSSLKSLAVPVGIEPVEAKLVSELPEEPGWQFEPKWDGFRCLAFRAGDKVDLRAKSGKPLGTRSRALRIRIPSSHVPR